MGKPTPKRLPPAPPPPPKGSPEDKPVSLHPMTPDEALRKLASVRVAHKRK